MKRKKHNNHLYYLDDFETCAADLSEQHNPLLKRRLADNTAAVAVVVASQGFSTDLLKPNGQASTLCPEVFTKKPFEKSFSWIFCF
jgi:hypothetical protein